MASNLRLDHVGTQALSAEYVGDETEALAKERKWLERVGLQVRCADVRPLAIRIRIEAGRRFKRRGGGKRHSFKIGRCAHACRQARDEFGPRNDKDYFMDRFRPSTHEN